MTPDEYASYDATELAQLTTTGEIGSAELLDAALRQVERRNPTVNAIVNLAESRARRRSESPSRRGLLAGVPMLVKDTGCDVAGIPTTYCSRLFADAVAAADSPYVQAVEGEGAVVFGKTTAPEFAGSSTTEPGFTGPTRNPWNPAHTTGGSSGGAAAVVAAGIVPVAHATDSGGSIRIPASCCGLVGLKPTRGRIGEGPTQSLLSTTHVVSRTVRDSALLLDVTHGAVPGDLYMAVPPSRPYRALLDTGAGAAHATLPSRLRIAYLPTPPDGSPVHPDCAKAAEDTARILESLGHHIEPAFWPTGMPSGAVVATIHQTTTARLVAARLRRLGRGLRDDDVDDLTRQSLTAAASRTVNDYVDAVEAVQQAAALGTTWLAPYHAALTPTMPILPPLIGEADPNGDLVRTRAVGARMLAFTGVFSLTGQPAVSLPTHISTTTGLPVGVQLAAAHGREDLLLRLAAQIEQVVHWTGRAPGRL